MMVFLGSDYKIRIIRIFYIIIFLASVPSFLLAVFYYDSPWGLVSYRSLSLVGMVITGLGIIGAEKYRFVYSVLLVATVTLGNLMLLFLSLNDRNLVPLITGTYSLSIPFVLGAVLFEKRMLLTTIVFVILGWLSLSFFNYDRLPTDLTEPSYYISLTIIMIIQCIVLYYQNSESERRHNKVLLQADQLRELVHERRIFIDKVVHDIRTPLQGMFGILDLVIDDKLPKDIARAKLTVARYNLSHLSYLVDRLEQSQILGTSNIVLDPNNVDLKSLMDSIIAIFTVPDTATFSYNIQSKIIYCDAKAFSLVVYNLVSNAIKYLDETDNALLEISCLVDDNNLMVFSVVNECTWQGQEGLDILKEEYKRSTEHNKIKGKGMGLSIVDGLAKAMDADFSFTKTDKMVTAQFVMEVEDEKS